MYPPESRAVNGLPRLMALVLLLLCLTPQAQAQTLTPAGTVISNRARLDYTTPDGDALTAYSPEVTVTVQIVNGVRVTPDESAPSGTVDALDLVTAGFSVCNTGNQPLPFVVASAAVTAPASVESVHLDADDNGTVGGGDPLVALGVTRTPAVQPGACTPVLVRYSVNRAAAHSLLTATLLARAPDDAANPSGQSVEDSGAVVRVVREGPIFRNPDDPKLPPRKTADGAEETTAGANSSVEFEISFRNVGEGRAEEVRVYDELPAGLTYQPGSLRLAVGSEVSNLTDARDADQGAASGRSVEVLLPAVDSQQTVAVRFRAQVAPLPPGTLLINSGVISAANHEATRTTEARVILAPQGMVFDGGSSRSAPVAGASVRLVSGSAGGALAALPAAGFSPNAANSNPYVTAGDGLFSFRPATPEVPSSFFLLVDAEGFRPRVVEARLTPSEGGRGFGLRLDARDGQPLAAAGGVTLVEGGVSISGLAAMVCNVPMFSSGALQISKSVDRSSATIGDVLTYRVEVTNTLHSPAFGVRVRDTLPQSFFYVPGSGTLAVGGSAPRALEPAITGDVMEFRLPDLPAGAGVTLTYRVRIGVNALMGTQYNVAVAFNGDTPSPTARVPVTVRAGLFSTNQFVIGRVFVDTNGDGRFDGGDKPVEAARLITSQGRMVLTDASGNYHFPVLSGGAHVIQLDPSSVPEGAAPHDPLRSDGSTWSHFATSPLMGGSMLRADFALKLADAGAKQSPTDSRANRTPQGAGESAGASGGPVTSRTTTPQTGPPTSPTAAATPQAAQQPKKRRNWFSRALSSVFGGGRKRPREALAAAAPTPAPAAARQSAPEVAPAPVSVPAALVQQPTPELPDVAAVDASQFIHYPSATFKGDGGSQKTTQTAAIAPPVAPAPTPQVPDGEAGAVSGGTSAPAPLPGADVRTQPAVETAAVEPPPADAPRAEAPAAAPVGVAKVSPGGIEFDVEPDAVSMKPGFDVPVRVANGWGARLYLNGSVVDQNRVGETRVDASSLTTQLLYVGLDLVPGANVLRAVAVSPDGREHASREMVVYGRGPAASITLEPARGEIPAGRGAATDVVLRALDKWENPALDGEVLVSTSLGKLTVSGQPAAAEATVKLKDGRALVQLVASDSTGTATVTASSGATVARAQVRFGVDESSPRMLVGYGSMTFGRAAPVMGLRGISDSPFHGSLSFFYTGEIAKGHRLTLAYDSQSPLQRLDGRDRLFQTDPLDYDYKVFGDTSHSFNAAPSNSKVYARVDYSRLYGRSYFLFGDFMPEKRDTELAAYNRNLTGVQFHFENRHGDYVSFGGAHPDTVFGRDVFPGGLFGFVRLSASDLLAGSETVTVETRDRRNPDLLVSRTQLARGVDYNLDDETGFLFFKNAVPAFDASLNLRQIVVTYEYRAAGRGTLVYTARASKTFRSTRTRLGFSANLQQQGALGNFALGGIDATQKTPGGGELHFEYARSTGRVGLTGTYHDGDDSLDRQGNAYLFTFDQPLRWRNGRLQASFRRAGAGFYNPFGSTVVGGAQRGGASLDLQASRTARLRLGFTDERNRTGRVDNSRQTFGAEWTQQFGDKLTGVIGYDFRRYDSAGEGTVATSVDSHLVTAGLDWRPNDRLQLSVKREQNLAGSDPTYPNQTLLSASYKLNDSSRLFATQRLSSAPVTPIPDLSGGGFAFTPSRREFTAGIETKFARDTSLLAGYRVENGVDSSDGYAVFGLGRKWKLSEQLSLDASFERAFHVSGKARSGYNILSSGLTWKPRENFIGTAAYQWRTRDGGAQAVAVGFAGKPFDNITALGNFQWTRGGGEYASVAAVRGADASPASFVSGDRRALFGSFGVVVRPVKSDRVAAFFNYERRSFTQGSGATFSRDDSSTFSADAFVQALPKVSLFAKAALKSSDVSITGQRPAPTLTYLLQGRAEYRAAPKWDFAIESRYLAQPSTGSGRLGLAPEVGYWATPDLRFGVGYNLNRLTDPGRSVLNGIRRGFYFSVTTKFERVFDFLGARKKESK